MVLGPGEIDQERHERLKARLMARARREAEMGILGGLSEAEARIAELEQELAAAEQARDTAQAARDYERNGWLICTKMRLHAEQRATRLAALEAAAPGMAWVWTELNGRGPMALETAKAARAVKAFLDAVAALDVAPGEPE